MSSSFIGRTVIAATSHPNSMVTESGTNDMAEISAAESHFCHCESGEVALGHQLAASAKSGSLLFHTRG